MRWKDQKSRDKENNLKMLKVEIVDKYIDKTPNLIKK